MLLTKESITNGRFSAWTGDNPDSWPVTGEVGSDPMVNEVGQGEGQGGAGTGYCNLYASTGTDAYISQVITDLVKGRKYIFSINVDTLTANNLRVVDNSGNNQFPTIDYNSTGVKSFTFVAVHTDVTILIRRQNNATYDITFNDISIRAEVPAELLRTGHSFASRQET